MSTNKPPRGDALWPWYFVTVLYLGFGALVLYDRWGEVGSLFEAPGTTPGRLPLNSIGDILAGFFAPLAFLWLFVATQLQRKELRLQREELADTRAVLNDQRMELERSARESNAQTLIMQKTLESSNIRVSYEEFGIKLYFFARVCSKYQGSIIYFKNYATGRNGVLNYISGNLESISQSDHSTVDQIFGRYRLNLFEIVDDINSGFSIIRSGTIFPQVKEALIYSLVEMETIIDSPTVLDNDLILARISGLGLKDLLDRIRFIKLHVNEQEKREEIQIFS